MSVLTLFSLEAGINKLNRSDVMFNQLQQLADRLEQIQPHLKMSRYLTAQDDNHCATSCCLAGWGLEWGIGASAGIVTSWHNVKTQPFIADNANSLGYRYACSLLGQDTYPLSSMAFKWLFSEMWSDNLKLGIHRLRYFTTHQSPPVLFAVVWDYGSYQIHTEISVDEIIQQLPKSSLVSYQQFDVDGDFLLIELESRDVYGTAELFKQLNSPIALFLNHPRSCSTLGRSSLVLHKDDIGTFNRLIQPIVKLEA